MPSGREAPLGEQEVKSPLIRLISETAGIEDSRINADSRIGEDIGLDSLGRVELLAAIEASLGIYLDDTAVSSGTTVSQLQHAIDHNEGTSRPHFAAWPLSRPARLVRAGVQAVVLPLLRRLTPTEVVGVDRVERLSGPVLFTANHSSHLDSITVLAALPPEIRKRVAVGAAADYFFSRRWLGVTIEIVLNAFPFSRTSAVRPTLEHCRLLLDEGWSILLFPEGTRSTTGTTGEFKSGVGLLAVELDVPVVPVHLDGLDRVLPKGRSIPRPGPVSVSFGEPIRFERGTKFDVAAKRVESEVRKLAPGKSKR